MAESDGQSFDAGGPAPDAERMGVFAAGMTTFGVGEPGEVWPNNIIATDTIVQASGVMSRAGWPVAHVVDEADLAFCKKMAEQVAFMMRDGDATRGNPEITNAIEAFYIPGDKSQKPPESVSEALIRERFGGSIFPGSTISIQPVRLDAVWWIDAEAELIPKIEPGYERSWKEEYEQWHGAARAAQWRRLIQWFIQNNDHQGMFIDTAYVEIGDFRKLPHLAAMQKTFVTPPSALPRLIVGLTAEGGLAGGFWVTRDYYRFWKKSV